MVPVEELIRKAKIMNASDLHITVGIPPRVRVDGDLVTLDEYPVLTPKDTWEFVMRMMNDRLKAGFDRTGEADFSYAIPEFGRARVNAFRQKGACACTLRMINTEIPTPEDLGLPQSVIELCTKKRGLVLVTGPTGSGKSTTLASLINRINENRREHIITIEDPIEYLHVHKNSMVNQRELGIDTMSYSAALRAALREDPDVILVGEMRDLDTISTAITAAETGHLVFSTLHTIGAAATIDRAVDVFPAHQQAQIRMQLSVVLEAVISQQLIPKTDKGRIAAFEVMHGTVPIKNLIRDGKTFQIQSIIQTNRKAGMITMDDSLIDLCNQGYISPGNAVEYAQDREYVEKRVGFAM